MTTQKIRLLIIDDSLEDKQTYEYFLQGEYQLLEAELAVEGLLLAQQHKPDCILLDYHLPDMDGLQVLEQIRKNDDLNHTAILMLTSHSDSRLIIKALQEGALDFLDKNKITSQILKQAIQTAIHKTKLIQLKKERERARYARSLIEASLDPFVTISPQGKITDVNHATEIVTGLSHDTLVGSDFSNYFTDPIQAEQVYLQVFSSGSISDFPLSILHTSGKVTEVLYNGSVFHDNNGDVVGVFAAARDVTEKNRIAAELNAYRQNLEHLVEERTVALELANQQLKTSDERFKFAMKATNAGLWDWNLETNITNCSKNYFLMLGYQPEELKQDVYSLWLDLLHPDDYEDALNRTLKKLISERNYESEFRMRSKSGEYRWILSRGKVVKFDTAGNPTQAIGLHTDITERKEMEIALKKAKQQAELANQAKSAFLANMSHEIRTPMNAVLGFCYLLEQQNLTDNAKQLVHKINMAGNSLLAIINDILDFSKIEAGHVQIEHEAFDLNNILEQLAAVMMSCCQNKPLELIICAPNRPLTLVGDYQHLLQVLVNLVSNAIKFTETGSIELKITVDQENQQIRFAVSDTGIGVSEEKKETIFSAFIQEDASINRRFGGTGLGLAISQQLVKLMGGTLSLNTQVGEGSEFYFVLPLQEEQTQTTEPSSHFKILLWDACLKSQQALANSIESLGWQVFSVDSDLGALSQILADWETATPYHVLLCNWNADNPETLAVIQTLHDAFQSQPTPQRKMPLVLFVSAYTGEALENQAGVALIDGFLTKPVTPSALLHKVINNLEPNKQSSSDNTTNAASASSQRLTGVRILIVDDSEFNLEVAQLILQGEGAIVTLASGGYAALTWLKENPDNVDIVLMDIQMPDLDGLQTTKLIRAEPRWKSLPIIALSAGAFKPDQELAYAAGMNDFIVKPFNTEHLLTAIKRWNQH